MNLRKFPKVELHRHLEGALRYTTLKELCRTRGLDLPYHDDVAFKEQLLVTSPMKDLQSVLNKFWTTQSVLDSEEILERITFEAIEDAKAENIELLELRYSLSFIQINHPQLNYQKIHSSILKGMERGVKATGVKTGLIGIIGRVDPPDIQKKTVDFMCDNAPSFLAIDLADNESGLDTKTLVPLFEKARKSGLHVTVHAGEQIGCHQNVKDSIEMLGAERIGHGIQIHAFPELMKFVVNQGVTLEVCPYSNYLTGNSPTLQQHPIRKLIQNNVKVALCSDDPGIFNSDLTHEFEILVNDHGFTESELKTLVNQARISSFIK